MKLIQATWPIDSPGNNIYQAVVSFIWMASNILLWEAGLGFAFLMNGHITNQVPHF